MLPTGRRSPVILVGRVLGLHEELPPASCEVSRCAVGQLSRRGFRLSPTPGLELWRPLKGIGSGGSTRSYCSEPTGLLGQSSTLAAVVRTDTDATTSRHLHRHFVDAVVAVAEPVPFGPFRLATTREVESPRAHDGHARFVGLDTGNQLPPLPTVTLALADKTCSLPAPATYAHLDARDGCGARPSDAADSQIAGAASWFGAGSVIKARTCWSVTGSRTSPPSRSHSYQYFSAW